MDNPMELLNQLLKNNDAVDKVKSLINTEQKSENSSNPQDMSFLLNMLSENKQSAEMLNKMKSFYDAYNDNNDPSIRLLNDLTPFLSDKRMENIDKIAKFVRISKALNKFGRG